jgi:ribosomal protein S18 acetylase RimI-like enzyme
MATLRRLGMNDSDAAGELTRLFADPDAGPGDLPAWLANESNVMIGAWLDDEPAGMVYGYFLPRPDARADMLLLYSIDVAPAARRQGIGRSLLEAFRREAPEGVWLVTNDSNTAAIALYGAAGAVRPHPDDAMLRFGPLA